MLLGAGVWLKHTGQQLSSLWKAESSRECWCDGEGTDWNLEFQEYFPAHFYRNWFLQSHKWCETYKEKKKKISKNPQTAPCPKSLQPQTYWEVDITVELTEGPDHLCEALADSDVQGCALGVVQQVCTGSFSQQHTGNFSLVSGLKQSQRQSRVNPALTENSLCLQSSRTQVLGPLSHTSLLFSV